MLGPKQEYLRYKATKTTSKLLHDRSFDSSTERSSSKADAKKRKVIVT